MEFTGLYTAAYNPSLNAGCELCPVDQISWEEIQLFIHHINLNTGKAYRLPTEAEWEYAAKGGNQSNHYIYSGSNDPDEVAWYDANSNNKTHQVGLKKPNELGVFDMSGNVIEWCSDWYDSSYYSYSAAINPVGADSGSFKVSRGGSYFDEGTFTRTTNRSRDVVNERYINYGFRLVLSAE